MDQPLDGKDLKSHGSSRSGLNLYLSVAAPIFFALFFVEYLPLFAVGYWSWTGTVHKVLSGIFLILNLGIAELVVRRSRSRSRVPPVGSKTNQSDRT